MKGAHVISWGSSPVFTDLPDLPHPSPTQLQLKVLAVGVPRVVQARAAGKHSSVQNKPLPLDPSLDGVGLDESTGDLYFITIGPKGGAPLFAERVNAERSQLIPLEKDADPVTVAALVNPVSSSWLALTSRAAGGVQGRNVLVLGATGASGRIAVKVARSLGAARIVGIARSADKLATVEGLDERVLLKEPFELPESIGPLHIILDYVGGRAAVEVMKQAQVEPGTNLDYVHIGDLAGEDDIRVPSSLLNKKPLRIMGSGMGAWSKEEMKRETPRLVAATAKMTRTSDIFTAPLSDVESVWDTEDAKNKRLVFVP
ncbi:hypothetical protein VPNG_06161 [Cytospora leucostoma]|uniref:Enoyl reductase (ER) domain-containing protein n=1 Tax=Cytospora leucostoma TaxID=1230097 RepID=A0A423WYQ8_9PEZI|nr:hypothetical protein VPNG_06161 [Cytospora leucostoma]